MIKIITCCILLAITTFGTANAQKSIRSEIKLIAKAGKQNIKLRWAPTSAAAWQRLTQYGYTIERVTLSRNDKLLSVPEKIALTSNILPKPLEQWEIMIVNNDFAAIAAQAIFGETFELTENYSSDIVQVINKSKELDQRFSFALFAADQSFSVAEISGLGYVDASAKNNEKYLYRVISGVPEQKEVIKKGFVYIGLQDYVELPVIYDFQADFRDKVVLLSWERENFDGTYNSFIIEKSIDGGKSYSPITNLPIVNTMRDKNFKSRLGFKMDSLKENGKKYFYRIKGINAFGEISPPSEPVFGSGFIPISSPPQLTEWATTDNRTVDLVWTFESNPKINGFKVERSNKVSGPFTAIKELSSETRTFNDNAPLPTNYYRITAFNVQSSNSSFPVLVQLEDSIPPMAPVGILGIVDTSGIVTLRWNSNIENDLLGYRVYRANFKNAEFARISNEPIKIPNWTDSINIKSLTSSIYYKVTAIDNRYNESLVSETLTLERPDLIPPVPPVFKGINSLENGIELIYIGSSSRDVSSYQIYRKQAKESEWLKTAEKIFGDSTYWVDTNVQINTLYEYTIIALDSSGNESKPAAVVSGSFIRTIANEFPQNVLVRTNRNEKYIELTWQFNTKASEFKIYRRQNEGNLTLYKTISGEIKMFLDENLSLNSHYEYGVQAVLQSGITSKITFIQIKF